MDPTGTGKRVRIYVGEHDHAPGANRPLWEDLLMLLRDQGAAGATMFRGLAGFGAHSQLHLARVADLVPDLPVVVEWIDGPERVDRLLPRVCAMVTSGLITVDELTIARYTHRAPRPMPPETVSQVMTRSVVAAQPTTPLGEVVRMLVDRDYRALPVVDAAQQVVGMITNRDLVERGGLSARVELLGALGSAAIEQELAAAGVRGRTGADVMTREVISVAEDESLPRAAHLMVERGVKRLPVVDKAGTLVGIISRADVLRTMGQAYPSAAAEPGAPADQPRRASDIMRTDVPVVSADASLGELLDKVTSSGLNRAIVVDRERRVLGVVSDAELLARLDPSGQSGLLGALMGRSRAVKGSSKAGELVHGSPVTVHADTALPEAARLMLDGRHKVLPIVDGEGRLLGVAGRADLLRAALSQQA